MKVLMVLVCCCICTMVDAQSAYQVGLLPSINLNKKLIGDWHLNLKIESRQLLTEGLYGEVKSLDYEYVLTDFALLVSNKIGLNNKIAGGYLSRYRNYELIHRLIQQFTYVKRYSGFRMAHRFSADQTFIKGASTEYRFRYRITAEFPFNGNSVDPGELYLKINNEYLNSLENGEYDLEVRLVPLLGFKLTEDNKLEFGLDYRRDSFIGNPSRNRFWTSLNWYLKL